MKILLPILRLFWVAFCALSLMAQTRLLLGLSLAPGWIDGFVFGGTVFGYYCTHPIGLYRKIAWAAGLGAGTCFLIPWMAAPDRIGILLMVLAPVLFWLAYYGFKRPGNAGLRGHPLAKPLTIALTWAWVTVLLPPSFAAVTAGETAPAHESRLIFLLFGRAAFIFALALAYDLCDEAYDHRQGLKTLTSKLGFGRSIRLIYKSLALAGLCVFANLHFHIYGLPQAAGLFASLGFSARWLPYLFQIKTWEAWQKPLIDGLMIFQFLFVLLFSHFFHSTL